VSSGLEKPISQTSSVCQTNDSEFIKSTAFIWLIPRPSESEHMTVYKCFIKIFIRPTFLVAKPVIQTPSWSLLLRETYMFCLTLLLKKSIPQDIYAQGFAQHMFPLTCCWHWREYIIFSSQHIIFRQSKKFFLSNQLCFDNAVQSCAKSCKANLQYPMHKPIRLTLKVSLPSKSVPGPGNVNNK